MDHNKQVVFESKFINYESEASDGKNTGQNMTSLDRSDDRALRLAQGRSRI